MSSSNRKLLTLAIIAFDLMVKDAIESEAKSEPFHDESIKVIRYLTNLLNNPPDWDHRQEQYILNVAEIAARIKIIFAGTPILEDDLDEMLMLQSERLKWLGKITEDGSASPDVLARSLH